MNIIFLFILIILCILLCLLINNERNILSSLNSRKKGGSELNDTHESPHVSSLDLKSYISNYMDTNYNDNIVKKKINHILNYGEKKHHNTNIGDIAIDTLNVIYFIYGYDMTTHITDDNICIGIEYITKKLKKYFPGRVMFVVKDKNTLLNDNNVRNKYAALSKKLKIFIYIVEKYDLKNSPSWKKPTWIKSNNGILDATDPKLQHAISENIHSLESRDDLALILLSKKYRCPILSNDSFRDNSQYRATIAPFKVLEYNWFSSKNPTIETYRPENLKKFDSVPNLKIKLENIFIHGELEAIKLLE